jgi:plasmid stability protein
MPVETKTGRTVSDAELDRLATKAEAGFDLSAWRPRRGRPSLGGTAGEHAPRIAVRVPEALRDRARVRAATEGRSISEVVRSLLEEYAPEPTSGRAPARGGSADRGVDAASEPVRASAARHGR